MANRDTFSRYIYNLHETVNKMLKKKSVLNFVMFERDMNILGLDVH